jgi:hypothetical protein
MTKRPETVEDICDLIYRMGAREAAALIHEWLPLLPPPGSVRVRIAVGFDADGDWMPFGGAHAQDYDTMQEAQHYQHAARIVWIEADIPPPAPEPAVTGRVVP